MHTELMFAGDPHMGIIVSHQRPIGDLMRRLLRLARTLTAEEMIDRLEYLNNWPSTYRANQAIRFAWKAGLCEIARRARFCPTIMVVFSASKTYSIRRFRRFFFCPAGGGTAVAFSTR